MVANDLRLLQIIYCLHLQWCLWVWLLLEKVPTFPGLAVLTFTVCIVANPLYHIFLILSKLIQKMVNGKDKINGHFRVRTCDTPHYYVRPAQRFDWLIYELARFKCSFRYGCQKCDINAFSISSAWILNYVYRGGYYLYFYSRTPLIRIPL